MDDLVLRGKALTAWSTTGVVLSSEKRAETRVYGSGGGRFGSSTTTKHEIWLKLADGTEQSVQLAGVDVPLREGQKITVVSAGSRDGKAGWIIGVINQAVNRHWFVTRPIVIATALGLVGRFWNSTRGDFLIAVVIVGVLNAVHSPKPTDSTPMSYGLSTFLENILIASAYVVIRSSLRKSQKKRVLGALDVWIVRAIERSY